MGWIPDPRVKKKSTGSGYWTESFVPTLEIRKHIAQTFPNFTRSRFPTILANICNFAHAQFERTQGVPGVRRLELGAWLHGDVSVGADPAEAALCVRPHCLPGPEERSRQNWSLWGGKKTRISLLTLRRMYRYYLDYVECTIMLSEIERLKSKTLYLGMGRGFLLMGWLRLGKVKFLR